MKSNLIKNEDGTYNLTLEQLQGLSDGDLKVSDGCLYRTEHLFPQKVEILELKQDGEQPLNLYGEDKQRSKFQELTIGNQEWVQTSHHPMFNGTTQTQIERCKQYPPVEIKGVCLKGSKTTPVIQEAIKSLIRTIQYIKNSHPYIWVDRANMLSDWAGEESKPYLLNILNSAIPLKPGMKLKGFSVHEFEQKYLYTQPSLLEQAQQELTSPSESIISLAERTMMGVPFAHRDMNAKLLPLLDRLFYSSNGPKGTIDFEQFVRKSMDMFNQYREQIKKHLDYNDLFSNWTHGIYVQEKYWDIFRGYTITILKLYINMLDVEGKEKYGLSTPIKGMKKD